MGFGTIWLTQRLREFHDLYPEIRIELHLNDEQVDIGMRAADVAIWTREPPQSDLIRRMLFTSRVRAFASTQYVRRFGAPKTLDDLDGHRIAVLQRAAGAAPDRRSRWLETAGRNGKGPREPSFRANSVVALRYAIRAGIGIGMIPDYMTDNEADLVPVLTEIDPADAADPVRLPGGAQVLQKGAGAARFPRRPGPPVEVLTATAGRASRNAAGHRRIAAGAARRYLTGTLS